MPGKDLSTGSRENPRTHLAGARSNSAHRIAAKECHGTTRSTSTHPSLLTNVRPDHTSRLDNNGNKRRISHKIQRFDFVRKTAGHSPTGGQGIDTRALGCVFLHAQASATAKYVRAYQSYRPYGQTGFSRLTLEEAGLRTQKPTRRGLGVPSTYDSTAGPPYRTAPKATAKA